jgi:drug/metabolite transporter (DMT)-like permease
MSDSPGLLLRLAPALFVMLWSTGWIAARAVAPHADPLTFLALRFSIACIAMAIIVTVLRAPKIGTGGASTRRAVLHAMVSGILLHTGYLATVWYVVAKGVPAGVSGVIAAVQPILTALLAPALVNERISSRQWAGIGLGFAGIMLVLQPRLASLDAASFSELRWLYVVNFFGMLSVTLGTFYQKRFVPSGDLRTVATWQYVGAALSTALIAWWIEPTMRIDWTATTILTMAWSVIALSIGAVLLLLLLIRDGAVSRAATLIYLVPSAVVFEAWLLFGETVNLVQVAGIALTATGVALAVRK